ncbi:hypothetical protein [Sinomicrobium sp. M5D2P9]
MKKETSITVEIFRTNITYSVPADICMLVLSRHLPHAVINFDLEDTDHILRIEDQNIDPDEVIHVMESLGITCELL